MSDSNNDDHYTPEERAAIERKLLDAQHLICNNLHALMPDLINSLLKAIAIRAKNFAIEHGQDDEDVKLFAYQTYITSLLTGLFNVAMDYFDYDQQTRLQIITHATDQWLARSKNAH